MNGMAAVRFSRHVFFVCVLPMRAVCLRADPSKLLGRRSLNAADDPGLAEDGLAQGIITNELKADGTGSTYDEGTLTSSYGNTFCMNDDVGGDS